MSKALKQEDNPFGLSVGDLMAALLLIFVLLLMATLLKLQKEREDVVEVAKEYLETKKDIYNSLTDEFSTLISNGTITIDTTLMIRFVSPSVKFSSNQTKLNSNFQSLLTYFFPKYIQVLEPYRSELREIRIEGHTDNNYNFGPGISEYFYNMELSQGRTRSTLEYCLKLIYNDLETYKWVKPLITANGLSSSKLIRDSNAQVNKSKSRRVEFRIRTNAEEKLDEIYSKYLGQ